MTHTQEEFLKELKSKPKMTVAEYAEIYKRHNKLAIEEEVNNGAGPTQAEAMGNYYCIAVLSNFMGNENILSRIVALKESTK